MKQFALTSIFYLFFLLLLLKKDKNDGEKELFKKQNWKRVDVLIVMVSIIFYGYFIHFLFGFRFLWPLMRITWFFQFELLFFFLILALIHLNVKQGLETLGFKKSNYIKAIGLGVSAAIILFIPHFINNILLNRGNESVHFLENLNGFEKSLYVVMAILISPILEESLYRGVLYSPYRKKFGPTIAIIINASIFYLGHYMLGIQANPLIGLICCLFYEKTESIYPPIFAHSFYNLSGVLIAFNVIK